MVYRLELAALAGARVYIGESSKLRRRVNGYRNPGPPPSQTTNNQIDPLLCEHLAAGESVTIAVATTAEVTCGSRTCAESGRRR